MSINYIFNGYYRSGTSLIFNLIKKSNEAYKVFYEPLHPRLKYFINNYYSSHELDKSDLFYDYLSEGVSFIEKINNNNKKGINSFPTFREIEEMINIFDEIYGNVILQTNRLHFSYGKIISDRKYIKIYHIIRNPIDVYNSFYTIVQNNLENKNLKDKIFRIIKYNPFEIKNRLPYYLRKIYNKKIKKHVDGCFVFGIDKLLDKCLEVRNDYRIKDELMKDEFKLIIYTWVISNYYALKGIPSENVIMYEEIISSFNSIKSKLEMDGEILFKEENIKIYNKEKSNYEKYKDKRLIELIDKLGIRKEYDFIIGKLGLDMEAAK